MFKNLVGKTLYDKRWFIFGWSLGLIAMCALTIAFFPTIKDSATQLFQNIPKQFQNLVGDTSSYSTITGYIGSGIFELRIPMLTLPMSIILAVGLTVSEESSGKMYQLLAQPVSRSKIVLQKWLSLLIITTVIFAMMTVGIIVTTLLIKEHVPYAKLGMFTLMCWLMSMAVSGICFMVGAASGRKGLTIFVSSFVAFGGYLISSFATQVSWLKNLDYISLFHYYHPSIITKQGLVFSHILVLVTVSIVSIIIATIGFANRDIGVND